MALLNIFVSAASVVLLIVGLVWEIRYAKLPEGRTLKTLWFLIICMVGAFIFGYSSLTVTLVLKYAGIIVPPEVINNIVAFTFLGGGVWMSSMIILEHKVVQSSEEKKGEEKMLAEVEKTKQSLKAEMDKRMADVKRQTMEMKKNTDILVQKEAEIAEIRKEIAELEAKEKNVAS